jgi:hypothetical protein
LRINAEKTNVRRFVRLDKLPRPRPPKAPQGRLPPEAELSQNEAAAHPNVALDTLSYRDHIATAEPPDSAEGKASRAVDLTLLVSACGHLSTTSVA